MNVPVIDPLKKENHHQLVSVDFSLKIKKRNTNTVEVISEEIKNEVIISNNISRIINLMYFEYISESLTMK